MNEEEQCNASPMSEAATLGEAIRRVAERAVTEEDCRRRPKQEQIEKQRGIGVFRRSLSCSVPKVFLEVQIALTYLESSVNVRIPNATGVIAPSA